LIKHHKKAQGSNILCYAGGTLENSPFNHYEKMRNEIYSFVSKDRLDGIIISGAISSHTTKKVFVNFCEQLRPIPMITTIIQVPNAPVVQIDDTEGIRDLITHLIQNHNYKRIAFICGPEYLNE